MKKLIAIISFIGSYVALIGYYYLNPLANFSLDTPTIVYTSLIAGYGGISQWTAYLKSGDMPVGTMYNKNTKRLGIIIVITFLVFLYVIFLASLSEKQFPVSLTFSAFGASISAYVLGQSAKIKQINKQKIQEK